MRFRLTSELKSHYPIHFVDGKLQPPEIKEDPPLPKPPSPSKDLEPLLILKPPELPLLTFNHNKELPILSIKPTVEKELLDMKSSATSNSFEATDDKNRYTITINSCDKNGLVNGITINIPTKDS